MFIAQQFDVCAIVTKLVDNDLGKRNMKITGQGAMNLGFACVTAWFAYQANQIATDVAAISNETSYKVEVTDVDLVFKNSTGTLRDVTPVFVTPRFRSPDNTISVGERVELPPSSRYDDVAAQTITFRNVFSSNGAVCVDRANRPKCVDNQIFRVTVEYSQNGIQDMQSIAGPSS